MVERFRHGALAERIARASRVEREFGFRMAVEDVILSGQIDLWFEEGGELVLVDYKTDRTDQRLDSYALQLRFYAMALEKLTGKPPDRALLMFLRSGREVEVPLVADVAGIDSVAAVREFREAQDRMEFPLREGDHCRRCQFYRGLCPAGR